MSKNSVFMAVMLILTQLAPHSAEAFGRRKKSQRVPDYVVIFEVTNGPVANRQPVKGVKIYVDNKSDKTDKKGIAKFKVKAGQRRIRVAAKGFATQDFTDTFGRHHIMLYPSEDTPSYKIELGSTSAPQPTPTSTPTSTPSSCDPISQPSPHWGMKNGQCLRSCGALGGDSSPAQSCSAYGYEDMGTAYDVGFCCRSNSNSNPTPEPTPTPTQTPPPSTGACFPGVSSNYEAAALQSAQWVRSNHPEFFHADDREVAYNMMTKVINILRHNGYDARRILNHPSLPMNNYVRWGTDALYILSGSTWHAYDVYSAWPEGPAQTLNLGNDGGVRKDLTSDLIPVGSGCRL